MSVLYIIVGAGSAGCVLANRLSQDRAVSVLPIECCTSKCRRAGGVYINGGKGKMSYAPIGGYKRSGIGLEK